VEVLGLSYKHTAVMIGIFFILSQISISTTTSIHSQSTLLSTDDSNNLTIWADGCFSLVGWTEMHADSGFATEAAISGTGGLQMDSDGFIVPFIPDIDDSDSGPLFVKQFTTPFTLADIVDFRVIMGYTHNVGYAGCLRVILFDETLNQTVSVEIYNRETGPDDNGRVRWTYYPLLDSPTWVWRSGYLDQSWDVEVSSWYDDVMDTPCVQIDIGDYIWPYFRELTYLNFETDRSIHYIGIQWVRNPDMDYSGYGLSLHDIRLIHRQSETFTRKWFHDCSNVSYFSQITEWDTTWWGERILTGDGVRSVNDSLVFDNMSSDNPGWHGPIFIHEITDPFPLSRLMRFSTSLEVTDELYDQDAKIELFLLGEDYSPILSIYCRQVHLSSSQVYYGIRYYFSNYDTADHYVTQGFLPPFEGRLTAWMTGHLGVLGTIPYEGRMLFTELNDTELNREISFIGIIPSVHDFHPMIPVRVHDILLETASNIPLTNPTSPGESDVPFVISPSSLISISVSLVSLSIIVIFTTKTIQYRRSDSI